MEMASGKKPNKKIAVILLSVVGLILICAIVAGALLLGQQKPSKVVDKFEAAVKKSNVATVQKLLVSNDPSFVIEKEDVKRLVEYLKDERNVLDSLVDELYKSSLDAENGELTNTHTSLLTLVKDTSGWRDTYKIAVEPYYVYIYTNQKGVNIALDGQVLTTSKTNYYTKLVGPLMPGSYTFDVNFESEYASVSTTKKVDLPDDLDDEIDLSLDADYVYLDSNYPEAMLYVNGKETNLTIDEAYPFGPVAIDGSMTLQAKLETEWGELKSEEFTIVEENEDITLDIVGYSIYPYSNVIDAEVLVNGKVTGINFEEAYNYGIGPIPYGKTVDVSGQYQFPWGQQTSSNVVTYSENSIEDYTNDQTIYFNGVPDDIKNKLADTMDGFLLSLPQSIYSYDESLLVNTEEQSQFYIMDSLSYTLSPYNYDYTATNATIIDANYIFDDLYMHQYEKDTYLISFTTYFNYEIEYSDWDGEIIYEPGTMIALAEVLYDASTDQFTLQYFEDLTYYYEQYGSFTSEEDKISRQFQ